MLQTLYFDTNYIREFTTLHYRNAFIGNKKDMIIHLDDGNMSLLNDLPKVSKAYYKQIKAILTLEFKISGQLFTNKYWLRVWHG